MRKQAQKICRKYRPLPYSAKRGRSKNDWRYKGCVETKATKLRKVHVYSAHSNLDKIIPCANINNDYCCL